MPPKKTKHKPLSKKVTKTDGSLTYLSNVINTIDNLYHQHLKANGRIDLTHHAIFINNMHINDPDTNGIPALCCYISQMEISQNQVEFFESLRGAGLLVKSSPVVDTLLLKIVLEKRNIALLDWLLVNCDYKIPATENDEVANTLHIDIYNILEFITRNFDAPESKYYLEAFPKYNVDGNTVLHLAVIHNKLDLFHILIQNGSSINQQNKRSLTPLMLAIKYKCQALLNDIMLTPIGKNIDVSLVTENGETIFHHAILAANKEIFEFALTKISQQGLSFSALTTKDGFNIVHWAIEHKQCAILDVLIRLVDKTAYGPDGNHLIGYAFINNEPDIGYFISQECKFDLNEDRFANNKCIFQIVIEHDALISFSWLVENGYFDHIYRSNFGIPPLLLAAKCGSNAIFNELTNIYDSEQLSLSAIDENGKQFGHYLAELNLVEDLKQFLDNHALDLNHKDIHGNTILDIALMQGKSHSNLIDVLLSYIEQQSRNKKRKLKINLSDLNQLTTLIQVYCEDTLGERLSTIDGFLPLHLACLKYEIDYVRALVAKNNLDINQIDEQGESALSLLVKNAAVEKIIALITRLHPRITNLDKNRSNILHLACEYNLEELVVWCLNNTSLSSTSTRSDGFSALDITIIKRQSNILRILWSKLNSKQTEIYLKILQNKKESLLLEYLSDEGLYQPIERTQKLVEIKSDNKEFDDDTKLDSQQISDVISSTEDNQIELKEDFDILNIKFKELNCHAQDFKSLPNCFLTNKFMYEMLIEIGKNFKKADLDGFVYGSSHYKLNPGDIDILIPNSTMQNDAKKISALIGFFISQNGTVTSIDKETGCYGYSYEGRHVIPIFWMNFNIEIILYPGSILQHAQAIDFTRSARYLSVVTMTYAQTPGINPDIDIACNRIQTIVDASQSFLTDPRRIFRAIKLMVDENSTLSDECYKAIQQIFYSTSNPFITHTTPRKIYHRMAIMMDSQNPMRYFDVLNDLGIFNKLFDVFIQNYDYAALYYRGLLANLYGLYQMQDEQQEIVRPSYNSSLFFKQNNTKYKEVATESKEIVYMHKSHL